jgi:hypothetical protein
LPAEDQALGGALVNAVGQFGRAIGLAICTALQTAVMARDRGVTVANVGPMKTWDAPTLAGVRAANWFNFAIGVTSLLVVLLFFRSNEIVGKASPKSPRVVQERSGGEEGIMNEERTDQ